jgi:glycosyltransferase involved in cell wall biosynthesis
MALSITVILPVYNAANYLLEAIESILNQSFKDFELIIINDGSTDDSEIIINSILDKRIRYIKNDGNKGLIYTLNRGIEEATGVYIVRMDADDVSLPTRFEKQYAYMEQNPDVGACGTYAAYIGNRIGVWQYPVLDTEIRYRLMWGSSIIHPSAIIRKSVLTQHNIKYNEQYLAAEDYKLWVDIAKVSKLYNIPEILLQYRTHNKQVTTTKISKMDNTKSKIIFEQIVSAGVTLSEKDFDIISKFVLYTYNFTALELNRLFEIYVLYMQKNKTVHLCNPVLIDNQIKERLFEACYFSTKNCGLEAVKIFNKQYKINEVDFMKRIKFYYKAFVR